MTFYFGLRTSRLLSDIQDNNESLYNLNLDVLDLNKIRGISTEGLSKLDFRNLSGLDFDLQKMSAALDQETSTYPDLTKSLYNENTFINGDIDINGQLAAMAIRYSYLKTDNTVGFAEISTSRVSAWSSFDSPQNNSSPIFYGGMVEVNGPIELSDLIVSSGITQKRFQGEVPTHRIKTTISGNTIYLYAMKGIPLVFRGFFRNFNGSAKINLYNNLKSTWVVKDTDVTPNREFVFDNISGTTSNISFKDISAKPRNIEFYYHPNYITSLTLSNSGIYAIPDIKLANLVTFNLSTNDLSDFPDFSGYTSLTTLNISNNDFTRARSVSLRTFSNTVVSRLSANLTTLYIDNCFDGPFTGNLINTKISTFSSIGGATRKLAGESPAVNSTAIVNYNVTTNSLTSISNTVLNSNTLQYITITNNPLLQSNLQITSDVIKSVAVGGGGVGGYCNANLIDVSNKTSLISYTYSSMYPQSNTVVTSIFDGCRSLDTVTILDIPSANGAFPSFAGCVKLRYINFYNTNIGSANSSYVLTDDSFGSCKDSLQVLQWYSPSIGLQPFQSNCFKDMTALYYLYIGGAGNSITGSLPDVSSVRNLTNYYIFNTQITGNVPDFANNKSLRYVYLYNNKLSGKIPDIQSTSLQYLYLYYNNGINGFASGVSQLKCPNLIVFAVTRCTFTGIIDFSNLKKLQYLLMEYNQISTYTVGSFAGLTSIRYLYLNNNQLRTTQLNQIIKDLWTNYKAAPRSKVIVNLTSNPQKPSGADVIKIIRDLQAAGWTINY